MFSSIKNYKDTLRSIETLKNTFLCYYRWRIVKGTVRLWTYVAHYFFFNCLFDTSLHFIYTYPYDEAGSNWIKNGPHTCFGPLEYTYIKWDFSEDHDLEYYPWNGIAKQNNTSWYEVLQKACNIISMPWSRCWASIHYADGRLTARSREVSKPRDSGLNIFHRSEIWQAPRQHRCRDAC